MLQELDLTCKRAFEIAQAMEVASHDVHDLQKQLPSISTVQHLQDRRPAKQYTCYRCGGNHTANKCIFLTAECRSCGKIGHFTKVCCSKSKEMFKPTKGNFKKTSINSVVSNHTPPPTSDPLLLSDGQDDAYTLFTLPGKPSLLLRQLKSMDQTC